MKTNLQALRKKAGYKSARAFAEKVGIPVSTYTDYEQGYTSFSLTRAWEFADILDCSLDELAGREFNPQKLGVQETNLLNSFRDCTPERKSTLIQHAKDAALASKRRSPALVT